MAVSFFLFKFTIESVDKIGLPDFLSTKIVHLGAFLVLPLLQTKQKTKIVYLDYQVTIHIKARNTKTALGLTVCWELLT